MRRKSLRAHVCSSTPSGLSPPIAHVSYAIGIATAIASLVAILLSGAALGAPAEALLGKVDGFLARRRMMGLLILQGDRILVERYQYNRTAEQRFHSQPMAKTVVAMLVGIALQEGKDPFDRRPRTGLRSGTRGLAIRQDEPPTSVDHVVRREVPRKLRTSTITRV